MKSLLEYHNKYIIAADDKDTDDTSYLGLNDKYEPNMDNDLNGALLFSTTTEAMGYLKRIKDKHEIDDLLEFDNFRLEMIIINTKMIQKFSIHKL